MKKILKNETGLAIVEATIVFPVMFLVIFLMIFAGNAYWQKCRVDAYVNKMAIEGAARCADPMLEAIEKGYIPDVDDIEVRPYRYLIGGMSDIETSIKRNVTNKVRNLNTGLFSGMQPASVVADATYNNGFIYSTFSVSVEYKVCIPVRLMGASDFVFMRLSSHADVPVSDTTEFIRNVDMVEDYLQRFNVPTKLEELIAKVKEWTGKGG